MPIYTILFFLSYKIFNRGNNVFPKVKFGLWTDFDIGCFANDLIGCDTLLETYFGYNPNTDDNCASFGYNNTHVFQGVSILNTEIKSFADLSQNGAVLPSQINYILEGKNHNGTPYKLNCDSWGIQGSNTNFAFPSNLDDINGISGINCNTTGDYTAVGATQFALNTQNYLCLDMAFSTSLDSNGTVLSNYPKFKQRIQNIQNFYNQGTIGCAALSTNIQEKKLASFQANVFPNPTENSFSITVNDQDMYHINVFDATGKKVYENQLNNNLTINTANWSQAVYTIQISNNNSSITKRLIKM